MQAEVRNRIIDLGELRGSDDFPAYAAVYSVEPDNPHVLSPSAMRWSENTILSRLWDCRAFWLEQKKKLRCRLIDLFEPLLLHHYGEDYVAVLADHPWQCLLYLDYQLKHKARGLYLLQSRLNRNIYRKLGWDYWFDSQSRLGEHLLAANARGFRPDSFRARQAQMRRFIERIGIATPYEMSAADANSIRRRFGKWLGLVWQWSFTESSELQFFPWQNLRPQRMPSVERDLEYPVNQWACIELLLREDLDRLCEKFKRDDCRHINRMSWQIRLFNHRLLTVELCFRHPYSLHRDAPAYATALYQARYLYEDSMRKLKQRDSDLDLPESMPFISWKLEVAEFIMLAPSLWDLFASQHDAIDYQRVMALQNKLPLAFECYQSDPSYFPERSFSPAVPGSVQGVEFDCHPWASSAANKPLFCYQSAQPMESPAGMQRFFLERSANQWWLGENALQSIRDYFMLKDRRGRASWVYRTRDGAWFKHGEYC